MFLLRVALKFAFILPNSAPEVHTFLEQLESDVRLESHIFGIYSKARHTRILN